jgi:predicted transcriptional regulator
MVKLILTNSPKIRLLKYASLNGGLQRRQQNIFKSHAFYEAVSELEQMGFLVGVKNGRNKIYKLTLKGEFLILAIREFIPE